MHYDPSNQYDQTPPPPGYPRYGAASATRPMQPTTDKVPNVPAPAAPSYPYWPQPATSQAQANAPWSHPAMPPHAPQPVPPQQPRRSRARGGAIFALTCLLAVVFGVGLFSGWTFGHSATSVSPRPTISSSSGISVSALEAAQEAAIAKVEPQVVEIQGIQSQAVSLGSGIIIDNKGNIVTNNHVISGATSLTVILSSGQRETATVVGTAPGNDLAIIHIQPFANIPVATFGDSSQLTIGQEVLAIGNPLGYSGTATTGVVSALNRDAQEPQGARLTGLIQTSAAINPGNSGGALINLQGQVVGIPTLSAVNSETHTPANGIGFAIPSNQVQAVITQVLGNTH